MNADAVERFFYTTHTPYRYSSGPRVVDLDLERHEYIVSLERAEELAMQQRVVSDNEDCVTVSWGTRYEMPTKTAAERAADVAAHEAAYQIDLARMKERNDA